MLKIKKIIFIIVSIAFGLLTAFLITELSYRFYLFGFALSFQDNRVIEKARFPESKKHVFFVGDSFTQGYPFPVDQSYPVILEKRLKSDKTKITNFALINSDLYDVVNIIRQVSELEPSLMVWGLSANDVYKSIEDKKDLDRLDDYDLREFPTKKTNRISHLRHALFDLPRDCLFRAKMSVFSTIKEILNTYSYVYIMLKRHLHEKKILAFLKAKHDAHNELQEVYKARSRYYRKNVSSEELFEPVFETILYVKNFLFGKGIDLIIFFVPQEVNLNDKLFEKNIMQYDAKIDDYDRRKPATSIRGFCLRNNIAFIDPSDYMEGELKRSKQLFMKLDRHYNYLGNNVVAEFLLNNRTFLSKFNDL